MPSPENPTFSNRSESDSNSGENEAIRAKYGERGSKANEVVEREKLEKEREMLIARNRELEMRIAILNEELKNDDAKKESEENLEADKSTPIEDTPIFEPTSEPVPVPILEASEPASETASEPASETASESSPEPIIEAAPENEKVVETAAKAKKNSALKGVLGGVAIIAVLGLAGAGIYSVASANKEANRNQPASPEPTPAVIETVSPSAETQAPEHIEVEKGIKDGYNAPGLWLSEHKDHDYDYGDAKEVGEICENDEVEMLKYAADNQVESLADYMAEFPEDLCPEGFFGLKPREIEAKLESLSPEEYDKVEAQAMRALDAAFTRTTVTQHNYHHYGMELKGKDGNVIHENMEMTDKGIGPGIEVVQFYWVGEDGSETGSMLVNIRRQYDSEKNITGFTGGLEVLRRGSRPKTPAPETPAPETPAPETPAPETPAPETPAPETPAPETPTPTPDWGKQGDPHGGDLVTPSDPVNPASEVTQEQNDQTNAGNEGYRDDNQAKPGDSSEQNGTNENGFAGSGITAEDVDTTGDRLNGGEDQSDGTIAGENPVQQNNAAGENTDNEGNNSQAQAQEENAPGGDNNSDASEEAAVAGGDF